MLSFPQEPMLAKPVNQIPGPEALRGGCLYEPKFDGYRALLFLEQGRCRVQSRRGHDITTAFPDIATAAAHQLPDGLVLDGELVVWGDDRLEFSELQKRLASRANASRRARGMPASFVAFDLLCVDDRDARTNPFEDRREVLAALLEDANPPLQIAPQTRDHVQATAWLAEYAQRPVGLEGVVAKGAGQKYKPGKRKWMKIRVRDTVEVIVGAVTGPLDSPERLLLGLYNVAGELEIIGGTGSLNSSQRRAVAPLLKPAADEHPWPDEISAGRLGHWSRDRHKITKVEPALIVEVSVDNAVEDGRHRHVSKFIRPRPDLSVEETEVV